MKIRKGFVSNSSSSSFVCEICGESEGGYDLSPRDANMACCENNHYMCLSHLTFKLDDLESGNDDEESKFKLGEFCEKNNLTIPETPIENLDLDSISSGYEIPKEWCPICNLNHISGDTIVSYISTKMDIPAIEAEIRNNFKTIGEVHTFIKNNKK